jgi:hypothetical protein
MIPVKAVHVSYVAVLQSESGRLLCHCSLTHILNGSTTMPCPSLWQRNLTSCGQFLYWDMKVRIIKFPIYSESITDHIITGSSPTVTVRQHREENPNVSLMHVGLIAGTPVAPKLAFSIKILELFYYLRRRQPSIGVQGFVKAICSFQQVCHSLQIIRK